MMPWDQQGVMDRMIEINKAVKDVSSAYTTGVTLQQGTVWRRGRVTIELPVDSADKKTLPFSLIFNQFCVGTSI